MNSDFAGFLPFAGGGCCLQCFVQKRPQNSPQPIQRRLSCPVDFITAADIIQKLEAFACKEGMGQIEVK